MTWIPLENVSELEAISEKSFSHLVVLFKHSTRCHISTLAKRNVENDFDKLPKNTEFYYLDLLSFREISNRMAEKFGVPHQSPQLIALKNGKVIYHKSHGEIDLEEIQISVN